MVKKNDKFLQAIKSVEWDFSIEYLEAYSTDVLLSCFKDYIKPGRIYPQQITCGKVKLSIVGTKDFFRIYPIQDKKVIHITPKASVKKLAYFVKKNNLIINCRHIIFNTGKAKAEYDNYKEDLIMILKEFINEDDLIRKNIPKLLEKGDVSVSIDELIEQMKQDNRKGIL